LQAAHWQALYGIEFLNEAASPVAVTDPNLVGEEAVAAMQTLGDTLYGFEIGNEPDLYSNQISGYTYADFQAQWVIYRDAILNAVAAAKAAGTLPQSATPRFTGPAAAYNQTGYVNPFAAAEAQNIFLLTRHYYRANGQSATSTMDLLLTPDPSLPAELGAMQTAASSNQISSGYRLSEANSFYNGGAPGISDGFGTSLWAINFLFTNALAGSAGVNFHGGGDGPGYTPIADNGSAAVEARPEYYGLYLFSQAASGQLVTTTLAPASTSLYAYAVTDASGINVVLVNTSATAATNVDVAFNGSVSSASFVALTGPNLNAAPWVPDADPPHLRRCRGGCRANQGSCASHTRDDLPHREPRDWRRGVLQMRESAAYGRIQIPRRFQCTIEAAGRAAPRRRCDVLLGKPCPGRRAGSELTEYSGHDRDAERCAGRQDGRDPGIRWSRRSL
jgi:hypothetical protein